MSLLKTDLRVFRAAVNNDTAANGGAMTNSESVSGVSGNLFPRVSLSERTNGVTRFRKAFHKVASTGNFTLYDSHLFMFKHTPAADAVTFFESDFTETQGDVTPASKTHYGVGVLQNSVIASGESLTVEPEQLEYDVFRIGDRIYISDKPTYENAVSGTEEYNVIADISAGPGDSLVLDLESPLVNGYEPGTRVASVMDKGDLFGVAESVSDTVAQDGALDAGGITVGQRGSIFHEVTFTFTSATNFNVSSNVLGSMGTGARTSTFAPVNPSTASPYLSVPTSAWSGTFQSGDVVTIRTIPAVLPVMYMQQVPAGSLAFSGNSFTMVFAGETE